MTPRRVDRAEILAHHTGGGDWWTREISQRIGVQMTLVGVRRGWAPASVTFAAVALSVATSAAVLVLGRGTSAALVAAIGWQLAYGLDCSDGQLARVTGRTSVAGAAIDLYGDWLSRVAMVVALVLSFEGLVVAPVVLVLLMAGQLAGLFHESVGNQGAVADLPRGRLLRAQGVLHDPGILFLAYAASLAAGPRWTLGFLLYGAAWGALRYMVRYARLGRVALRR